MQIDYFPLYYGFKESLQLNGNEIILYSYLINKLRLSVGHGYHGKNGKNYYNDIDEMFYVATSANRLTNIPWIPNNRHTISRYLRHLQSLRLIICHQRRHYTVINFPMIQPVIDALLIDGEIVPPQNHLQNNILHGVAKNKPYDQRSKKAPHVQTDKDVPNVNRNLTESKLNPQSKLNSVTDSTLQKQGYLQWIRNTHSNLGIRKKSLAYISDFCIRYDLTNKDATKFAKLIIEAKNTVMKNNHIRHTESTRFENNKRLQKDLLYSLEDIINQIDMNTHHNRYGKRNKQQHRTPDINHYYGYVVNELKWCFRNCFFDDKDKPRENIIVDNDQKDDINDHKDGFGNKYDMKTGKHFKNDKSGDNDSKLNSMDQITNEDSGNNEGGVLYSFVTAAGMDQARLKEILIKCYRAKVEMDKVKRSDSEELLELNPNLLDFDGKTENQIKDQIKTLHPQIKEYKDKMTRNVIEKIEKDAKSEAKDSMKDPRKKSSSNNKKINTDSSVLF